MGALYFCFGAMERATWPNLLPSIGAYFEVSSTAVAWTVIAFAVGMAGSTLTAGRLGDMLGHRRLAASGFALEGLLLLACAVSPVLWPIFLFRFLQGFAAAAALNNVTAIAIGSFPRERRGRAIGAVSGFAAFGLMIGPLYGGFVGEWLDWRWAIAIIGLYVLAQAAVTLLMAPPDKATMQMKDARALHWTGAFGFLVAMITLIVAAQLLRSGDTRVAGAALLAVFAAVTALTIWRESRAASPILGLRLFKEWNFSLASGSLIWFSLAFGAMNVLFPFYLQEGLGWTLAASGLMLVTLNAVQPWGSPVSGLLADRFGSARVMAAGAVVAFASLLLAGGLGSAPETWQIILPLALFGASVSLFMPPVTKLIFAHAPQSALAGAASMATSGRYVGQSLGVAFGAALLVAGGGAPLAEAFGDAMTTLAAVLAGGLALMALARPAAGLIRRRRGTAEEQRIS